MAKKLFDTPDTTTQFDPADIELNNRLSCLAYLGLIPWLIPMLLVKKSRFAKYHANQGLVLLILNLISGVILGVIKLIAGLISSGIVALCMKIAMKLAFFATVGTIFSVIISIITWILITLVSLAVLFLTVVGIIYAAKGRAKELPLIGRFKLIKY